MPARESFNYNAAIETEAAVPSATCTNRRKRRANVSDLDADAYYRMTRYLSGGCSATESAEMERWLAADVRRQRELDVLRRLWEAGAGMLPEDRVDEMWHDVARQLRASGVGPSRAQIATPDAAVSAFVLFRAAARTPASARGWRIGLGAAAALVLAAGYGAWQYRAVEDGPSVVAVDAARRVREYRTIRRQRGTVQLEDGTRIELGVASVLRVHPFTSGRRDVELEGEGVFDVTHDSRRPFAVRSGGAVIEDLGTRFGVRAYGRDAGVRVVVAEGKVALRPFGAASAASVSLSPGDLGTVDVHGRMTVRHDVAVAAYLGWTSGRLFFDNAPLAEVAADLERWYDIDVMIDTRALAERRVTVNMPVGSLADALAAVAAPLGLTYTLRDSVVTLHDK